MSEDGKAFYLDLLILHLVLDGAQEDAFLSTVTDLEALGNLDHGVAEFVMNGFVDVDSLDCQTDLARVEEGKCGDLVVVSHRSTNTTASNEALTFCATAGMSTFLVMMAGSLPPLKHVREERKVRLGSYSQLESNPLQSLRGTLHNLLAGKCRTREADLVRTRMAASIG